MTKADDPYRSVFNPIYYLCTYYNESYVADDEDRNLRSLVDMIRVKKKGERFGTALEVGCGPTIHHAIPLAPHVDEIHLSDYLSANLAEVRKWLDAAPGAHDWGVYLRGVLEMEGVEATPEAVDRRAAELRAKVTALKECDLHRDVPLGEPVQYDLVTSFYTAECATRSRHEWEEFMRRLASLVRPGGTFFQVMIRNGTRYAVGSSWIPIVSVNESDLAEVLPRFGFAPADTHITPVSISDWVDHGFEGVCIVKAIKRTVCP